jgi:3-oxoacyl-[acyl-carrier-protein] synthase II
MGVLTKHMPSPFDRNRDGFAIGEGACFVVIENIEEALRRNKKNLLRNCGLFKWDILK